MILFAGMTAVSVARKPADLSGWYGDDAIYNVLEKNGLTQGYSVNEWYVNCITVLSERRITSLGIGLTDGGFEITTNLTRDAWYKDFNPDERTFLIVLERDLFQNPWLEDEAVEVLRATQYTPYYGLTEGYFILVYDHDVIGEYLRQKQAVGDSDTLTLEN